MKLKCFKSVLIHTSIKFKVYNAAKSRCTVLYEQQFRVYVCTVHTSSLYLLFFFVFFGIFAFPDQGMTNRPSVGSPLTEPTIKLKQTFAIRGFFTSS